MGVGMEPHPLQNLPLPAEKLCPGRLRPGATTLTLHGLGYSFLFSGWRVGGS